MDYYRRNLPHWQPKGAEYFITFRLAGTLPKKVISELRERQKQFKIISKKSGISTKEKQEFQNRIFEHYDQFLDDETLGPTWLKNDDIAQLIVESMHFYDQSYYDLYAFTIMSNHVHMVFRHLEEFHEIDLPVTSIMKKIKSYTGKEGNKILGRHGKFWQAESYDRVIRDEKELENKIKYTLNNPVKAGLVSVWRDWPFSYCKPKFVESMK